MAERARSVPRVSINQRGALTLASFEGAFTQSLFRPGPGRTTSTTHGQHPDRWRLGWEYVPHTGTVRINLASVTFATSEGVAALAAVVECLRNNPGVDVELRIGSAASRWAAALNLDQIIERQWSTVDTASLSRPADCYTYPLARIRLDTRQRCDKCSRAIAAEALHLLREMKVQNVESISEAVQLIAKEALLNVFEHAYPDLTEKVAFVQVIGSPIPNRAHRTKVADVSHEELAWLEAFEAAGGMMLEVAIADYGRNVPSALWRNFARFHPRSIPKERIRLGSKHGQMSRAMLHHEICTWAFHHKSTGKVRRDFSDELAEMNWRGLHRAINTAAKHAGCVIIRSGQARAGYAFSTAEAPAILGPAVAATREFPGTTVILRIPIAASVTRKARAIVDSSEAASVIDFSRLTTAQNAGTLSRTFSSSGAPLVGIVHPFAQFTDANDFRAHADEVPPHLIAVHLFTRFEPSGLMDQILAFESHPRTAEGPPRLLGVWKPPAPVRWGFIGTASEVTRPLIATLLREGAVSTEGASEWTRFCQTLADLYSPYVQIVEKTLRLIPFGCHPSEEAFERALQIAFDDWSRTSRSSWLFQQPGTLIRSRGGRLAERWVSVLRILYSSDLLTSLLGWRLASLLRQLQQTARDLCLIAESEASYFIARMLLEDQDIDIDLFIGRPPRDKSQLPCVILIDAVWTGDTLAALASQLSTCIGIICCVDLGNTPRATVGPAPFRTLLKFSSDPLYQTAGQPDKEAILEADAVTHIPEEPNPEEARIGLDDELDAFARNHPDVFRYGLHRRGGRIHVVTLSTSRLVERYEHELVQWLSKRVHSFERSFQRKDVVLVSRYDANVNELVATLGSELIHRKDPIGRVFGLVIPFAPSGSREVFARPSHNFLQGLTQIESSDLFLRENPDTFAAVYVDDACVTGRALRSFLARAAIAQREQRAAAILAIPIVSRFSPSEELFFKELCRDLNVPHEPDAPRIKFQFSPLFRLQVRSADTLESTSVYRLALRIAAAQGFFDARLQDYAHRLVLNLDSVGSDSAGDSRDSRLLQHPFYVCDNPALDAISTRVVRIRHLLALEEQNVGVLGEILREVLAACGEGDYGVLTMLALEPSLLQVPPLTRECRHDISRLALNALRSKAASAGFKSDALSVLMHQRHNVTDTFVKALPSVTVDAVLVNQFLAFLAQDVQGLRTFSRELLAAIEECAGDVNTEAYLYVSSYVRGFEDESSRRAIIDHDGAVEAVRRFIALTSYHGKALKTFNALNDWLVASDETRELTEGLELRELADDAVTAAACIKDGLDGLIWWATAWHAHPTAAAALQASRFQALVALHGVTSCIDRLRSGRVPVSLAAVLADFWQRFRQHSHIRSTNLFLSRPVDESSAPALERWMPEFFSLPVEVATELASHYVPTLRIVPKWEQDERGIFVVVVVPFAMAVVREVFELLFIDMKSHGSGAGSAVTCSLVHSGAHSELVVDFENQVREHDAAGTGASQRRAMAMARAGGFTVVPDEPKQTGEIYHVRVTFPNPWYVPSAV